MQEQIDAAAVEAGRAPPEIRRVYNIGGTIADGLARGLLDGPPEHWVDTLTEFVSELGFDTFVFWPEDNELDQAERFAHEIAPALRWSGDLP
jgi:hypothetical protein